MLAKRLRQGMEFFAQIGPTHIWVFMLLVGLLAGLVKGVVGFAMPMVMISGLSTVVSPELALAGLILPTLVTNFWQALRQGLRAAWESVCKYRIFLTVGAIVLLAAAQLVPYLSARFLALLIGVPVTCYALATLMGRMLRLPSDAGPKSEAAIGAVAGFFGGISGIWGPPTVAMLTARGTEKKENIRVQGVIYGLGSVMLTLGHLGSGVLNAQTIPFSALMIIPGMLGLWLGFQIQDRIEQATFRKVTLAVLLIAGLNLIRRGIMGI